MCVCVCVCVCVYRVCIVCHVRLFYCKGIKDKALQILNPPYEEYSTRYRPVCEDRIDEFAIGFTMDTFLRFSAYGGVLHKPLVCVDSRRSPRNGSNLESYNLHINENLQFVFQIQMMKHVYNYTTAKTLLQGKTRT